MGDLLWSDTILDEARHARRRVERDLQGAQISGNVVVTGPASMPGVLTKGDVDLQLRVPPDQFDAVVRQLHGLYPATSLSAWAPTLAVFDVLADKSTGLAVTPLDSVHDQRFTVAWRRLREEPALLQEYNALKPAFFGTDGYERAKYDFFGRIVG